MKAEIELIERLRELYDNNKLSEKDEMIILDTLTYLGNKIKAEDVLSW